jgi:hypothetical protein
MLECNAGMHDNLNLNCRENQCETRSRNPMNIRELCNDRRRTTQTQRARDGRQQGQNEERDLDVH